MASRFSSPAIVDAETLQRRVYQWWLTKNGGVVGPKKELARILAVRLQCAMATVREVLGTKRQTTVLYWDPVWTLLREMLFEFRDLKDVPPDIEMRVNAWIAEAEDAEDSAQSRAICNYIMRRRAPLITKGKLLCGPGQWWNAFARGLDLTLENVLLCDEDGFVSENCHGDDDVLMDEDSDASLHSDDIHLPLSILESSHPPDEIEQYRLNWLHPTNFWADWSDSMRKCISCEELDSPCWYQGTRECTQCATRREKCIGGDPPNVEDKTLHYPRLIRRQAFMAKLNKRNWDKYLRSNGLQLGFEYIDPATAHRNRLVKPVTDAEWARITQARQSRSLQPAVLGDTQANVIHHDDLHHGSHGDELEVADYVVEQQSFLGDGDGLGHAGRIPLDATPVSLPAGMSHPRSSPGPPPNEASPSSSTHAGELEYLIAELQAMHEKYLMQLRRAGHAALQDMRGSGGNVEQDDG